MNKWLTIGALSLAATGLAAAAVDLHDFDDDVMRAMDDSFKNLEPVIGAGNGEAAKNDTEVLLEGLQWTEDYFSKKAGAEDAVKIAREGRVLMTKVADALAKKDFDGAAAAARDTAKNCKSCHELYKPLTK